MLTFVASNEMNLDAQKVDMFIATKGEYFPQDRLMMIREKLLDVDESRWFSIMSVQFKNPNTALILSIVLGGYGGDRFYIGDTGIAIGKLITCGGLGIWAIVDWFLISDATRQKNYEKLALML